MTLIASPSGEGLLATYDDLVAAIKTWLHRKDLEPRIPTLISLAEASINRIAQVRLMETEVTLIVEPGDRTAELPVNFTTPISVRLEGGHMLSPSRPEDLPSSPAPGQPAWWAIDGGSIALDCPATETLPIVLRYRGGFALRPEAPSNALLLKYPDLYLYGALLQSAPLIRDLESLGLWREMYARAVQEINRVESRARAVVPLRTEVAAVLGRCGGDFYRGC